jgi:hypothetical protein
VLGTAKSLVQPLSLDGCSVLVCGKESYCCMGQRKVVSGAGSVGQCVVLVQLGVDDKLVLMQLWLRPLWRR